MPVYRLTPLNPHSHHWSASAHRDTLLVGAPSATAAIACASASGYEPGRATKPNRLGELPRNPWTEPGHVWVQEIASTKPVEDREPVILARIQTAAHRPIETRPSRRG